MHEKIKSHILTDRQMLHWQYILVIRQAYQAQELYFFVGWGRTQELCMNPCLSLKILYVKRRDKIDEMHFELVVNRCESHLI